jgi:hypothetical protein
MDETVGSIERAAVLRQPDGSDPTQLLPPFKPTSEPVLTPSGPELVLDRGRLAGFGVAIPSVGRSRTVKL